MVKKIVLFLVLVTILSIPVLALAQAGGGAGAGPTIDSVTSAIETAVVSIGGSMAVVGWVVAGIIYLTAAGSPEKLGIAKKAMIAAIIGTLLVLIGTTSDNIISLMKDAFGIEGTLDSVN